MRAADPEAACRRNLARTVVARRRPGAATCPAEMSFLLTPKNGSVEGL